MRPLLKYLVYYFYRFITSLWRIHIVEHVSVQDLIRAGKPVILAHWHGDEYSLFHLVKRYKLATMTSTSADGAIVDFLIHKLGGATARGSSTRGGLTGLRGLIRLLKSGRVTSIAIDGPRGPIFEPKAGVFELSKLCGAYIVPVAVVVDRKFVFKKAWNKAYLPLPFSNVWIYFAEPLPPVASSEDPKDEKLKIWLKDHLIAAKQHTAKNIATQCAEC